MTFSYGGTAGAGMPTGNSELAADETANPPSSNLNTATGDTAISPTDEYNINYSSITSTYEAVTSASELTAVRPSESGDQLYVDDSNEMICPGFKKFNIFFKVILMKLKSGTLFFFNGVGKHKIISLTLAISSKSLLTNKLLLIYLAIVLFAMCFI